jgi:nucleoside-diphosphate-sugar epimerase
LGEVRVHRPGVLVTGATGFIGKHLTVSLVKDGLAVYALTRDDSFDFDEKVEIVKGDITQEIELPSHVETVFHCAGLWSDGESATEKKRLEKINVGGTEQVVKAALARGCRLIHLATATYAGGAEEGSVDEDSACHPRSFYEQTKYEAEIVVRKAVGEGLKAQILRSSFVFGVGRKPMDDPFLQLLIAIKRGRYRNIGKGDGIYNIIHVSEVVQALRMLDDDDIPNGGVYFINNPIAFREVSRIVRRATKGMKNDPRNIPFPVAYGAAALFTLISALTGRRMPLSLSRLKTLTNKKVFSQERLVSRTRYKPLCSVEERIMQVCHKYAERGLLGKEE